MLAHARPVVSLPLTPGVRYLLLEAGFGDAADLQGYTAERLAHCTNLSLQDAAEVLLQAKPKASLLCSAEELSRVQSSLPRIITFCAGLDRLLGGGVACGNVTEFCGVPGVGKTQLGMQLAVDVQIPAAFGGSGGTAVYVDTEGSFMVERVRDIAGAAVRHVSATARSAARTRPPGQAQQLAQEASGFTLETVLSGIMHFRIHDITEQLALVISLEAFLCQHPKVRLVVLDSVTFHFRQDFRDMGARARALSGMAQDCMRLAERHSVAVVFINQVSTRLELNEAKLVPALGESWGHAASTRVILYWQGADRFAFLHKSSSQAAASVQYVVTDDGVRDPKPLKRSMPPSGPSLAAPQ
ncbi:Rad51-like protein C [Haematococcus lacustris]